MNNWDDAPAGDDIEDAIDLFYFNRMGPGFLHDAHPCYREAGTRRRKMRYSRDIRATIEALDWFTAMDRGQFSLTCNKASNPWFTCTIAGKHNGEWWECEASADTLELAACRAMLNARTREELAEIVNRPVQANT